METRSRDRRVGVVPGMPLSEKQITQGFRISGGIEGVLTRLFNIICLDMTGGRGISPIQWNKLMLDYIRDVIATNTTMDRSSIRGNINKELRKPSMTWDVFMRKGLKFLKFEAFTISVHGDLIDGREYNAFTSVSFVPNSKFAEMFPKEPPLAPAVQRTDAKGRRAAMRSFSTNSGGVLAKLFTYICLSLTEGKGFSQIQWNQMLTTYIDQNEGPMLSADRRQSVRGNLNKEFRLNKMSWKVFCKSLKFLQVAGFSIHIRAFRSDGLICECEHSVNFAPRQ